MSAKKSQPFFALVFSVLMILSMCFPAFAADHSVDFGKTGSITVTLRDADGDHKPVRGGSFTLYKVADASSENYNLTFTYTEEFKDNGMSLDDVNAEGLAEHLAAYAEDKELVGDTKTAGKDGTVTWENLDLGLYLIVQSDNAPGYYPINPFLVSVPMYNDVEGGWVYDVEANPKAEDKPSSGSTHLTVKKVWVDDGVSTPDSITVTLLRDGKPYDTVELNEDNNWKHTWNGLSKNHKWTIAEIDVPEGYKVSYSTSGKTITITNTKDEPVIPNPKDLTVKKVWVDNGFSHPDSVTVELWKDDAVYETVVLSEDNNWTHTWKDLPEGKWGVKEINVPEGYTVEYSSNEAVITITNTHPAPGEKVEQTVKKVWSDDGKNRPGAVKVQLLNGDVVVDTVVLNKDNSWTHTWTGLDADGKWSVRETEIPKGYTPTYQVKGSVTVITNTASLIQTGQLNWPVPVLAGAGLLLFLFGWVLTCSKRKDHHAK